MPTYSPTITTESQSFLEVSSTDVTYAEILNSLGAYVYGISDIYMAATTFRQIQQVYMFQHYDSSGNQSFKNYPFIPDPYQKANAFIQKLEDNEIFFDGRSSLKFGVLPNEVISLRMFFREISTSGMLPGEGNMIEIFRFFDQYTDIIT